MDTPTLPRALVTGEPYAEFIARPVGEPTHYGYGGEVILTPTWLTLYQHLMDVTPAPAADPIAVREQAAQAERMARPRTDWIEEIDLEA